LFDVLEDVSLKEVLADLLYLVFWNILFLKFILINLQILTQELIKLFLLRKLFSKGLPEQVWLLSNILKLIVGKFLTVEHLNLVLFLFIPFFILLFEIVPCMQALKLIPLLFCCLFL
jgi:hypothetical protein